MSQLDGSTGATPRAEPEATPPRPPRVVLPPPPVAGLRTVARLRGAFDEGLPTLRLPKLPPRAWAEADAETMDIVVKSARQDTKVGKRPFSPSSMLRSGPRVLAPASVRLRIDGVPVTVEPAGTGEMSIRDLVEDTDAEELDDADVVDEEAGITLEGAIDPAATLPRGESGTAFAGNDAAVTLDGAPISVVADPTPVVHVPTIAVPPPSVLVHSIVAARPVAPRSRAWVWAVATPIAVLALAVTAWSLAPTTSNAGPITASLPGALPQRVAESGSSSSIETPPLPATSAIATPPLPPTSAIATPPLPATTSSIATPPLPTMPSSIATPPSTATPPTPVPPSVPPGPPVLESPLVDAASPAAIAEPTRKPKAKRSRHRPRAARPRTAPPVEPTPTPEPATVRRVPAAASNDATALLREAERAFAEGRFATALHFADRSRAKAPDARAARIAALAACRIGQAAKAKAAYAALPPGQRASVRKACSARNIVLE